MVRAPIPEYCRKAGFTLLEVLVAVSITSILVLALFGMFSAVLDVSESVREELDSNGGLRALMGVVTEDMQSCAYDKNGHGDFRFRGRSSFGLTGDPFMEFATTASLDFNAPSPNLGVQMVRYRFRRDPGNKDRYTFVREERKNAGIVGNWKWQAVDIMDGIVEFEARYYSNNMSGFSTEWDRVGKLWTGTPPAVEFRITYMLGEKEESVVAIFETPAELKVNQ